LIIIVRDGFFRSDDGISDQELLSFEISGTTRVGHMLRVTHDIKIGVMIPAEAAGLKELLYPEPDVRDFSVIALSPWPNVG